MEQKKKERDEENRVTKNLKNNGTDDFLDSEILSNNHNSDYTINHDVNMTTMIII